MVEHFHAPAAIHRHLTRERECRAAVICDHTLEHRRAKHAVGWPLALARPNVVGIARLMAVDILRARCLCHNFCGFFGGFFESLDLLVGLFAFVHVVLRLGKSHRHCRFVFDDSDHMALFYRVHISALIFSIQFFALAISPGLAGVSTPECPRDTARRGVALFAGAEAFGLFIDFVSCKVTHHPSDCFGRKIRPILDVTRSGHTDGCAAAPKLFTPSKSALGLCCHRLCRL
ncbi:MAG: hypothetical protein ACO29T_12395 [Steroidobacteraceae bacterium]